MTAHGALESSEEAGPLGPVAVFALLLLIVASPLMRGGNRNIALIALEGMALVVLAAIFARAGHSTGRLPRRELLIGFLLLSPAWLAAVYLVPLPASLWSALPGRALYPELLEAAALPSREWFAVSLAPDATAVSLLAGLPLMAAFCVAYLSNLRQLRWLLAAFTAVAFVEVLFGMLQLAGGSNSSLYFGSTWVGRRPFGTFANPNHFANYVGMALSTYIWVGWMSFQSRRHAGFRESRASEARKLTLWAAGALFLMVGVLMARSRGAAVSAIPATTAALCVALTVGAGGRALRRPLLVVAGLLAAGVALVGFDAIVGRFDLHRLTGDTPFRIIQAASTLEGAWAFFPFGSGWGTYLEVYPRFQPATLIGTADYAHHDYAQMLFEGGIFAVLLMAAFAWLAIDRAIMLVRIARKERRLRREEMASAICGIGLLGFLLHSLVEFNMHIPANAIAAALLAGVFLRPLAPALLSAEASSDD